MRFYLFCIVRLYNVQYNKVRYDLVNHDLLNLKEVIICLLVEKEN